MKATVLVFSVFLPLIATAQLSTSPSPPENSQDFTRCLINRKVDPKNVPDEDSKACLSKLGIQDPGDLARNVANLRLSDCTTEKAIVFDDGVSPVLDVAAVIAPMCASEWENLVAAQWLPPSIKSSMMATKNSVRLIAQTVLMVRRVRSESGSKSP
jgi:hypothetical protein